MTRAAPEWARPRQFVPSFKFAVFRRTESCDNAKFKLCQLLRLDRLPFSSAARKHLRPKTFYDFSDGNTIAFFAQLRNPPWRWAKGEAPTMPRNCRSARRMEGQKSGLRHRRRGGPALRGVAAGRFDGLKCGSKGAQAERGMAARSLAGYVQTPKRPAGDAPEAP